MRRLHSGVLQAVLVGAVLAVSCGGGTAERDRSAQSPTVASAWSVLGPGGGGGQFLPTINGKDPDNVYVRCDMTGSFSSRDGGRSWHMYNLRTVVQDFEIDPNEPNTVYASNSGLYRSEDKGLSWELIFPAPDDIVAERMLGDHADHSFETANGLPDGPIGKVRVDTENSNRIIIGISAPYRVTAARGVESAGNLTRIMVSSDRGATWKTAARVEGRRVLAIVPGGWDGAAGELTVITDTHAARIVEADGEVESRALPSEALASDCGRGGDGSLIYILTDMREQGGKVEGGVYVSADRGRSWTQANRGLLDDWKPGDRTPRLVTLAAGEGSPGTAYLSCSMMQDKSNTDLSRNYGILKTVDGGGTWRWVYRCNDEQILTSNGPGGWMEEFYGPEWGEYPLSLGVSPTDPDICYASDFGCTYRTLDGGATWEQVYTDMNPDGSVATRGMNVTTCYGVHFNPFDPKHLFISYTDIGAFHSFNGGGSWFHSINGVPRAWRNTCYWMVFDPEVEGRAWSVWGSGHDLPRPKMFRGNFERFVGGAAVSDDACRTWRQSGEGIPANTICTHVELDLSSPKDSRTLYVCGFGKGVFKSVDGGTSWKMMNNGLGGNLNAWRITLRPDGSLVLLVARGLKDGQTVDGAVYVSRDGAETWRQLPLPAGYNAPNDLVLDPSNPERMYLSCWPWPEDGRERFGGLLRSTDGGANWTQVFVEDAHVYAAAVDPDNPRTVIINTFNSAAFRSDNGGDTWKRLEGYTFKWGHRPVFDPHNKGMLYLTTFGGSVYYGPAVGVPGAREEIVNFDLTWRWGKPGGRIVSF